MLVLGVDPVEELDVAEARLLPERLHLEAPAAAVTLRLAQLDEQLLPVLHALLAHEQLGVLVDGGEALDGYVEQLLLALVHVLGVLEQLGLLLPRRREEAHQAQQLEHGRVQVGEVAIHAAEHHRQTEEHRRRQEVHEQLVLEQHELLHAHLRLGKAREHRLL